MTLDLHQNFVSAQYLDNKWTEFHQIWDTCIKRLFGPPPPPPPPYEAKKK